MHIYTDACLNTQLYMHTCIFVMMSTPYSKCMGQDQRVEVEVASFIITPIHPL